MGSWIRLMALVLRCFAFFFNLILTLGLFFLSLLVISSGQHNIQLSAVPLTGRTLTHSLLIASICGFVAMVLALRRGRAPRAAMLAWNILISGLLLATPLRGTFNFEGKDHMVAGVSLFFGSLVALWGSWLQRRARP